jgi:hypothetical protein
MSDKAARYFANSRQLVEALKAGDMGPAKAAGDLRQATADAVGALLEFNMKRLDADVARQEAESLPLTDEVHAFLELLDRLDRGR